MALDPRDGCIGVVELLILPAVAGGLGFLLWRAGSRETTYADGMARLEMNSSGMLGSSLCLAAGALYFGKKVPALGRLVRGEGRWREILWSPSSASMGLLALALWAGAIMMLTSALGIGPLPTHY